MGIEIMTKAGGTDDHTPTLVPWGRGVACTKLNPERARSEATRGDMLVRQNERWIVDGMCAM